jgi:adenosine deaminase
MSNSEFIRHMPKVELHVHLEASIRPSTLRTLARRNRVTLPAAGLDGSRDAYHFVDFEHFKQLYLAIVACLQTVDDFSLIAYEFGADMARQNIRYAEATLAPHISVANTGLPFAEILAGLNDGRARAREEFGVEFDWVLDIYRDLPETRHQTAEWAVSARDQGVIGLGLGGTEQGYPAEWFADAFALARQAGVHSLPHAGEVDGPRSVWGAIRALGAERIRHGVRSVEDPALVAYLREQQIPLDLCPTSNLCLGLYPTYEEHPIRWLWDQGLYVTVNSDDPPMFNTDLVNEYQMLAAHLGFTTGDLEQMSLNALRASFLPAERKAAWEQEFATEFARLRAQHLA